MTFSSVEFIVFFLLLICILSILRMSKKRMERNRYDKIRYVILLVFSYVFYGWWDWRFCFLMFFLTLVAFLTGIALSQNTDKRKVYLITGVAIPLIILFIFKYFNFFIDSFTSAFGIGHAGSLAIILPVGISFYTFQSLSYTIDVYRKKLPATNDFVKFALYISFFPQLVAGPIVKASDFLPQLEENRDMSVSNFQQGIQIFIFGLFKKIVIADRLAIFVDDVFAIPAAYHAITIILAIVSYSIQIYFDFSGYSDMAVGCAKCLGYDLMTNFNIPYISKNVSEFWKRWHISLSTWLKEYLYVSIGGNRKGKIRTYVNLLITMTLGGLWHGASWNFVLWGILHGVALCVHKSFSNGRSNSKQNIFNTAARVISTYGFVCFCWIFFRSTSIQTSFTIIQRILYWSPGIVQIYSWSIIAILIIVIGSVTAILKARRTSGDVDGFYPVFNLNKFWAMATVIFVVGLTLGLAYTGSNPFIYFQF